MANLKPADAAYEASLQQQCIELGMLTWLAMIGDTHQRLPCGEFRLALAQELALGQIHLLRRGGQPYAWFSWQQLDAAAHVQRLRGLGLALDADLLLGSVTTPQLWLNYWVRPFGCDARLAQAVIATLQGVVGSVTQLHWHDPSADDGAGKLYLNIDLSSLEQHS